ncbi:50S ribosomal protein L21 [Holospora undulata]|uniref:Large ribosomal subunit protein bL21 n=1 Tax=Holospora undulata HU1 TaxID=1321371 RepID=A0A061JGV4_9PROT|nr:50S ribosomal protein L21 [Holospora undulata]ETZ05325.1 50S ribosomal protein L21 [Holospora undulata HU1]
MRWGGGIELELLYQKDPCVRIRKTFWFKHMYTVLKTGGKQYHVNLGRFLDVERLVCNEGDVLHLDGWSIQPEGEVLPAKIVAVSLGEIKSKKVIIFKKKRRHNYRRKRGHRQILTRVRIESVEV